jgi:antitoxin component of MazEF toxin-antitoxin module
MQGNQFNTLIVTIVIVGLGVIFVPRWLDQNQLKRDSSLTCQLYRDDIAFAKKNEAKGWFDLANSHREIAAKNLKRGNCTPVN